MLLCSPATSICTGRDWALETGRIVRLAPELSAVPAQILHNSRGRQSFQRLSYSRDSHLLSPKLARVRAVFSVRIESDDQYFLCCDLAPLGQYLVYRTSWFAA